MMTKVFHALEVTRRPTYHMFPLQSPLQADRLIDASSSVSMLSPTSNSSKKTANRHPWKFPASSRSTMLRSWINTNSRPMHCHQKNTTKSRIIWWIGKTAIKKMSIGIYHRMYWVFLFMKTICSQHRRYIIWFKFLFLMSNNNLLGWSILFCFEL